MYMLYYIIFFYYAIIWINKIMKNTKQHLKLNNLQVKAEKCATRKEAKKILLKADKAQDKINK